jgi:glucan phosphoethanolaminetransferase (alkaline phosphatase superfamily)
MPIRPTLKEALLALYLLATLPAVAERAGSLGLTPALGLFLALWVAMVAGLVLAAYAKSFAVRAIWALLFAGAAGFVAAFERVTGQFLTYDAFINMVSSTGDTGNAVAQYGRSFVVPVALALLLAAALLLKPRRPVRYAGVAPLGAVVLLSLILYARGGEGARGLPPSLTGLAYGDLALYEAATEHFGPRQPVRLRSKATPPGDLVFLIDESVAAAYLDIDDPRDGVRSGLAEPRPGLAVANFGIASSITACSWGSNLTLRYGGTRGDYRRINATGPSLFAYARAAGFHTVYIDAQRPDPAANPLVADELAQIDKVISLGRLPVVDRDQAAAAIVSRYLRDGRRDFILVNKVGAHFPVHDKYPDAAMRYRPVLPRGHFLDISDTGSRAGFGGSVEEWRRYRNAYRNTLAWNVGAFFDRLLGGGIGGATILYTSDHGQNLHERGGAGLNTHCSPDPGMEEGAVPLVLIRAAGTPGPDWVRAAAVNRDRASHYAIFPTLLTLMGYDGAEAARLYGPPLDRPQTAPLAFNTLFNARLGRGPVWKPIDPARLARPPDTDFRR